MPANPTHVPALWPRALVAARPSLAAAVLLQRVDLEVGVVRPDYTETEVVAEEVRDDMAFRDAFGVRYGKRVGEAEGRGREEEGAGGEGVSRGRGRGGAEQEEGAHTWGAVLRARARGACVCV